MHPDLAGDNPRLPALVQLVARLGRLGAYLGHGAGALGRVATIYSLRSFRSLFSSLLDRRGFHIDQNERRSRNSASSSRAQPLRLLALIGFGPAVAVGVRALTPRNRAEPLRPRFLPIFTLCPSRAARLCEAASSHRAEPAGRLRALVARGICFGCRSHALFIGSMHAAFRELLKTTTKR
jgi:hypothetical protein